MTVVKEETDNDSEPGEPMDIDRIKNTKCHFCGRFGHLKKDCRRRLGLCIRCGKSGHLGQNCPSKPVGREQRNRVVKGDNAVTVVKEETDDDSEPGEPSQGFINNL